MSQDRERPGSEFYRLGSGRISSATVQTTMGSQADPSFGPNSGARKAAPALPPDAIVLVVDDDDDVRDVIRLLLAGAGYQVIDVENAERALVLLQHEGRRVRMLVADYAMPGMNGLQLIRTVRKLRPDLPSLLVTGYADFGQDGNLGGLAPAQFMRKPFRSAELLSRIAELIAAKPAGLSN
jgi:CheY-like chemotaxis protein